MIVKSATLLIHCPDKSGLVHEVTGFISQHHGNILDLQQHIDPDQNTFFMRIEWDLSSFDLKESEIESSFKSLANTREMKFYLHFSTYRKKVALFVSKENHCLYDLLARYEAGELPIDIPLIISNHEVLRSAADRFDIPFYYFPITADNKIKQENEQLALLKEKNVDTIVLARYMQIISPAMISHYPGQILNIHHSFLPAFVGAKPYHQAFERGVKIIGATSHYVTSELDQGPIIHQDIIRITHEDSVNDMIRIGRDLEKTVLSKALWWHVKNRVLVFGNKTVVFK